MHARQTSQRRTVGAAIPPRSVCWYAELVVRGSGCQRRDWRSRQGRRTSGEYPESERWDADSTLQMRAAPRPRGSADGKPSDEDLPSYECKGNVSCTSYSRTFYDTQMATANCVHLHAQLETTLSTLRTICMSARTHTDVNNCAPLSTIARRFRCVVVHAFIHRTCGSSLRPVCHSMSSMHAHLCLELLECSLFTRLSTSSSSPSSSSS